MITVTGCRDAPHRSASCPMPSLGGFAFSSLREQPASGVLGESLESHCASNAALYNVITSMISGRIGDAFAPLAVVCVLAIFLFPAMQGPYSVVHGPVSALLAVRAAAKVRTAMVQAALRSFGVLASRLVALCGMFVAEPDFYALTLTERCAILRC